MRPKLIVLPIDIEKSDVIKPANVAKVGVPSRRQPTLTDSDLSDSRTVGNKLKHHKARQPGTVYDPEQLSGSA